MARTGNKRDVYRVFVGGTEGKKPLARTRRGWKANIPMVIMAITEGAWKGEDGIDLA